MQPACRRIREPFIMRLARRNGSIKSVLLNMLLDSAWHKAGDRLPLLPALTDGSR
jgi:hypothetical protein